MAPRCLISDEANLSLGSGASRRFGEAELLSQVNIERAFLAMVLLLPQKSCRLIWGVHPMAHRKLQFFLLYLSMALKTYRIQHIWSGVDGDKSVVDGTLIWDREDRQSMPRMVLEGGRVICLERTRLAESADEETDFIYLDPKFHDGSAQS